MIIALLWITLSWWAPEGPGAVWWALTLVHARARGGVLEEFEIEASAEAGARRSRAVLALARWPEPVARAALGEWVIDAGPHGVRVAHSRDPLRYATPSRAPFRLWGLDPALPPLPVPHADLVFMVPDGLGVVRWVPWDDRITWHDARWIDGGRDAGDRGIDQPRARVLALRGRGARTIAEIHADAGRIIWLRARTTRASGEPLSLEWWARPGASNGARAIPDNGPATPPAVDPADRVVVELSQLGPSPEALSVGDTMPDVVLEGTGARLSDAVGRDTTSLLAVTTPEHAEAVLVALRRGTDEARRRLTIDAAVRDEPTPRVTSLVLVVAPASAPPGALSLPRVADARTAVHLTREPRLLDRLGGAPAAVLLVDASLRIEALRAIEAGDDGAPSADEVERAAAELALVAPERRR